MGKITKAQDIFLQLIELCEFNHLYGPSVAADLRQNVHLWRAVLIGREVPPVFRTLQNPVTSESEPVPLKNRVNLIVLRDLPDNHINLDTLYILAESGQQDALENLAQQWKPSEINWVAYKEAFQAMGASRFSIKDLWGEEKVILRLWWE